MTIQKLKATPYSGITPWLYTRAKINEIIDNMAPAVTIDDAISGTSENPVQNKVIKTALDGKANITISDQLYSDSDEGQIGDIHIVTAQVDDRLESRMQVLKNIYDDGVNPVSYSWSLVPFGLTVSTYWENMTLEKLTALVGNEFSLCSAIRGSLTPTGGSSIDIAGVPLCPYSVGDVIHVPIMLNSGTIKEFTVDVSAPTPSLYYDGTVVESVSGMRARLIYGTTSV